MNLSQNLQQRIQRTYRVTLSPLVATDGDTVEVEVNLSYVPDECGKPNTLAARLEAIDRLRRLANQGRAAVSPEVFETHDWDARCVRQTLVQVELGPDGKPIRKAAR